MANGELACVFFLFFLLLLFIYLGFQNRVSLWNPGYLGTHSVGQASLNVRLKGCELPCLDNWHIFQCLTSMEIKYISKLEWLFLQRKLVYPFSLFGVNIIKNKHLMLNAFLKKEYHGAQAGSALSVVLGWLWTPDPRTSTFCTIIQAVLETEPGLSAFWESTLSTELHPLPQIL